MSDWVILMRTLSRIESKIDQLLTKETLQMATINDLVQAVANERTLVDGVHTLVGQLRQQLTDALAGSITPEQQAKIDAAFADVQSNAAELTDALQANTPVANA